MRQHVWHDVIDQETRQIMRVYDREPTFKERPALLCIDNYNAVFGDRRESLLESARRFPSTCSPYSWDAVEPTRRLMAAARQAGIAVIHTTRDVVTQSRHSQVVATRRPRADEDLEWETAFFADLAPLPDELVVRKTRASAFFGTALVAHLTQMGVNQLIVCGNSTSGCVRASVVEGYEYGYQVAIVEECVFDRSQISHKVNLFDMSCKYADVVFLDQALDYLARVGNRVPVAV